ncbi:MAG: hypothetical protein JJU06_05845 [Ectothiorhodospiraceae bacterium]|nr:hypothetical protein [Ectothiorhodospiraceae bacterium]MCH8502902.1 hypothetical protein [Ectothiorhodospiraceae bacterium]
MHIVGVHGFNVRDGGLRSLEPTLAQLRRRGHTTARIDYGFVHLARVRLRMRRAVELLIAAQPEVVLAHSNGCPVTAEAIRQGLRLRAVIAYQPAMRRDAVWPFDAGRVLVLHNRRDCAVKLGRAWRVINPVSWFVPHYWGSAGAHGFTDPGYHVRQIDTEPLGFTGHSYLSADRDGEAPAARYWAGRIHDFINAEEAIAA